MSPGRAFGSTSPSMRLYSWWPDAVERRRTHGIGSSWPLGRPVSRGFGGNASLGSAASLGSDGSGLGSSTSTVYQTPRTILEDSRAPSGGTGAGPGFGRGELLDGADVVPGPPVGAEGADVGAGGGEAQIGLGAREPAALGDLVQELGRNEMHAVEGETLGMGDRALGPGDIA